MKFNVSRRPWRKLGSSPPKHYQKIAALSKHYPQCWDWSCFKRQNQPDLVASTKAYQLCHPQNAPMYSLNAQYSCKQQQGEGTTPSSTHSPDVICQSCNSMLHLISYWTQRICICFQSYFWLFFFFLFQMPPTFSLHFFSHQIFEIPAEKVSCLLCNSPNLN